jgi:hypothetical protein
MQDITDRLDAELRTPPPPTFDVAATVGAGRRAVRRRRLARGSVALALVLAVGGAGLAVTSQFSGTEGTAPGAVQVAAGVSGEGLVSSGRPLDETPAIYDPQHDDVILVRPGWEVISRVEDPVTHLSTVSGTGPVTDSTALGLRKGATTTWVVLFHFAAHGDQPSSQEGSTLAETAAETGIDTLAAWLDDVRTQLFTKGAQ